MTLISVDPSYNSIETPELTIKTPNYESLVSYFIVSTATLLVYDYCLTLDLECEFVWSNLRRWSNALYLIQRYLPFLDMMLLLTSTFASDFGEKYCYIVLDASLWLHTGGICLSEVVLSMRVWAISRDRFQQHFVYILSASLVGFLIAALTVTDVPLPEPLRGCLHTQNPIGFALGFGILVLYECGCFLLIVHPAISQFKNKKLSYLYNPVYRDGVFQYILFFVMNGINIAMVFGISTGLGYICMPLMRVLHSITTSRIVLHIRQAMDTSVTYSDGGSPIFDISSQSDVDRSILFRAVHSTETEA
ncbi:hypothetical protein BT96DRAFT_166646 [Gymnopus androsaceus JB14]|uniref:DUF6533 domain-containing protein n=1 Tax=Gymnopus androsaceus JB14 TaxID=1447944 RepID=A0A6A4HCF8_9AGAR|nr:hypothetical protein BT96DRAFT_166646 [Gymnopus androsaceus JB14]